MIKFKKYYRSLLKSARSACIGLFEKNRLLFYLADLMLNSRIIIYYMFDRKGRTPFRSHAFLDLTYTCNLQCKMCPQANDRCKDDSMINKDARNLKPLSQQEWLAVIAELAEIGCKNVTFSGGEPFLVSFLPDLIIMARKMNLDVGVVTNGMLINEKMANFLVDQNVSFVNISLEGSEEIDNQIKGNAGSYAGAISALNLINRAKKKKNSRFPDLRILPTLLSINYKHLHCLPEIANKFRAAIGVSVFQFFLNDRDITIFSNDKGEERLLPSYLREIEPHDFKQCWQEFISNVKKYNVNVKIAGRMTPTEIIKWYTDPNYVYSEKCLGPWSSIMIDPYGRMLTCMIGKSIGSVRSHSIEKLLNSNEYCDFRKELRRQKSFKFCARCCQLSNPLWTYIPRLV